MEPKNMFFCIMCRANRYGEAISTTELPSGTLITWRCCSCGHCTDESVKRASR